VWARCGGLCELCGDRLGAVWQAHHRRLRSRGGHDEPANIVGLHVLCHRRVHGHPEWATGQGFQVSAYADPAAVPLALGCARWVLLSDTYTDVRESA